MTPYEHGFLTKCAEYGVDEDTAVQLMRKQAGLGRFLLGGLGSIGAYGLISHLFNRKDPNRSMESYKSTGRKWGTGIGAATGALGGAVLGPVGAIGGALLGGGLGRIVGGVGGYAGGKLSGAPEASQLAGNGKPALPVGTKTEAPARITPPAGTAY